MTSALWFLAPWRSHRYWPLLCGFWFLEVTQLLTSALWFLVPRGHTVTDLCFVVSVSYRSHSYWPLLCGFWLPRSHTVNDLFFVVSGSLEVTQVLTSALWCLVLLRLYRNWLCFVVSGSLEVMQKRTHLCGGWFSIVVTGHTGTDNRFLKFVFRICFYIEIIFGIVCDQAYLHSASLACFGLRIFFVSLL